VVSTALGATRCGSIIFDWKEVRKDEKTVEVFEG